MNTHNNASIHTSSLFASALLLAASTAWGGVPLNNLQGSGGIDLNTIAYTAGLPWEGQSTSKLKGIIYKQQLGTC